MDFGLENVLGQPQWVLLAGSALLAAGMSVLIAAALLLLRSRRRSHAKASVPAEMPAAATGGAGQVVDLVDQVDEAMSPPAPTIDFDAIDERLEELETQLERLHARIGAVLRQRELRSGVRTATTSATADESGSDEEKALREMVARNR